MGVRIRTHNFGRSPSGVDKIKKKMKQRVNDV